MGTGVGCAAEAWLTGDLAAFCTCQWYQPFSGCHPIAGPTVTDAEGGCGPVRVEKVSKPLYCCHIAGIGGSGASGVVPADLSIQTDEAILHPTTLLREQEIGIWRTSRHRTFRTPS